MRASIWMMGGLSVVLCAASAFCAEGPTGESAISARMAVQQARLPQIEQVAAREREQIEQSYEQQRAEIARRIGRQGAARLSLAQRAFWTEFGMIRGDEPCPGWCIDASHFGLPFGCETIYVREAAMQEYFIGTMADLLLSDDFRVTLTQIVEERSDAPYLPVLRREARELLAFMANLRAELTVEIGHLEDDKTARADATMEWEERLKEQVHGILQYLKESESGEAEFGVVESIGYCPQSGYFCMVEGVDRVLETGDTVGAVRVLSIDPEKVEFAKDGAMWAQELGAPAQPHWE